MAQLTASGPTAKSPESQGSSSVAERPAILPLDLVGSLLDPGGRATVSDDAWLATLGHLFRPEHGRAAYARDGMTLLHKACVYNLPKCAGFLVNHSDASQVDDHGHPAIFHAAIHAHWDCLDALLPRFDHGFRTPEGLSLASLLLDHPDHLAQVVHLYDPAPLLAQIYKHYDRHELSRAMLQVVADRLAERAAISGAAASPGASAAPALRI